MRVCWRVRDLQDCTVQISQVQTRNFFYQPFSSISCLFIVKERIGQNWRLPSLVGKLHAGRRRVLMHTACSIPSETREEGESLC